MPKAAPRPSPTVPPRESLAVGVTLAPLRADDERDMETGSVQVNGGRRLARRDTERNTGEAIARRAIQRQLTRDRASAYRESTARLIASLYGSTTRTLA